MAIPDDDFRLTPSDGIATHSALKGGRQNEESRKQGHRRLSGARSSPMLRMDGHVHFGGGDEEGSVSGSGVGNANGNGKALGDGPSPRSSLDRPTATQPTSPPTRRHRTSSIPQRPTVTASPDETDSSSPLKDGQPNRTRLNVGAGRGFKPPPILTAFPSGGSNTVVASPSPTASTKSPVSSPPTRTKPPRFPSVPSDRRRANTLTLTSTDGHHTFPRMTSPRKTLFDDAMEGDDESGSSMARRIRRNRAQTLGGLSGRGSVATVRRSSAGSGASGAVAVGSAGTAATSAPRIRVQSMDNGGLRSPISVIDRQSTIVNKQTNLSEVGPRRSDSLASPAELEPRSRRLSSRKDSRLHQEDEEVIEKRDRKERREGKRKAATTVVKDDLGFEGLLDHENGSALPDPLAALLSSVDVGNAMRLISQQSTPMSHTVIPSVPSSNRGSHTFSPRHSMHSGSPYHSATESINEPNVAVAPPPLIPSPTLDERHERNDTMMEAERARRRRAGSQGGHVPFTHPARDDLSSSDEEKSVGQTEEMEQSPEALRRDSVIPHMAEKPHPQLNEGSKPGSADLGRRKRESAGHKVARIFSLNKRKKSADEASADMNTQSKVETEKMETAKAQDKIQTALIEMPLHPMAERQALHARSHFQAYYQLIYRSLATKKDQSSKAYLKHNPLRVIRWRKEVAAEELRRQNWERSIHMVEVVSSAARRSFDSDPNGRGGLPMPSTSARAMGPPLRSASVLSRAVASLASRPASPAVLEWSVSPAETIAYQDCYGAVDRFIPPAVDFPESLIRRRLNGYSSLQDTRAEAGQFGSFNGSSLGSRRHDESMPSPYGGQYGGQYRGQSGASTDSSRSLGSERQGQAPLVESVNGKPSQADQRGFIEGRGDGSDWTGYVHRQGGLIRQSPSMSQYSRARTASPEVGSERNMTQRALEMTSPRYPLGAGQFGGSETEFPTSRTTGISPAQSRDGLDTKQVGRGDNERRRLHLKSSIRRHNPFHLDRPRPRRQNSDTELGPQNGSPIVTIDYADDKKSWSEPVEMTEDVSHQEEPVMITEEEPVGCEVSEELKERYEERERYLTEASDMLANVAEENEATTQFFHDFRHAFQMSLSALATSSGFKPECSLPANLPLGLKLSRSYSGADAREAADILSPLRLGQSTSRTKNGRARQGSGPVRRRLTGSIITSQLPQPVIGRDRPMFLLADGRTVDAPTRLETTVTALRQQYQANLSRSVVVSTEQDSVQQDVDRLSYQAKALIEPASGNAAKIRRLRHTLQDLRLPSERSADNWFYALLRYLVNGLLGIITLALGIMRGVKLCGRAVHWVFRLPINMVVALLTVIRRYIAWLWSQWLFSMLLILVVWTCILVHFLK